ERGEARVANPYRRVAPEQGNPTAKRLLDEVFDVCDRNWRGIGLIPKSGLRLRYEYRELDAERRYTSELEPPAEPATCISGEVLRGRRKPLDCPAFGKTCTP